MTMQVITVLVLFYNIKSVKYYHLYEKLVYFKICFVKVPRVNSKYVSEIEIFLWNITIGILSI